MSERAPDFIAPRVRTPYRSALLAIATTALCGMPLALPLAARGEVSAWKKRFDAAWTAAVEAHEAKRWQEAVDHLREVKALVPHEPMSRYMLATALAHLGHREAALESLAEAVEYGYTDVGKIRSESAFEAFLDHERFAKILERARVVGAQKIVCYVPDTVDPERPAPLIVALHGRGENPHVHAPMWKPAAEKLGAVLVVPTGTRRVRLYNGWERPGAEKTKEVDLDAARKIVAEAIEFAREQATIDGDRIVLAGYSQGGAVALGLLAQQPGRFVGAWTIGTLYDMEAADWSTASGEGVRVFLLCGALDRLRPHSEKAAADLRKAGVEFQIRVAEGTGHEPPPDLLERQIQGVRFILRHER